MSWDITDRFPNWGESGESPSNGFFYEGGDQVNEKHLDYLWNSIKGLEDDVQAALDDIDDDEDGVVDEADTANAYKGNDIDSDGDGSVDNADNADKYDNTAPTDGTNGQFLQTDGTNTQWSDIPATESDIQKHKTVLNKDYTLASDEGAVLAGPISGDGSISGDGTLKVV